MNKKLQFVFSMLFALVLAFGQIGSASAKPDPNSDGPDCRITASTTTPVVGEPIQLTVSTRLVGPVSVYFGDGSDVQNGKSLWHTFHYVGSPVATAIVWFGGRSAARCTFDFTVSDEVITTTTPAVPTQVATPQPAPTGNASPSGSVSMGNGNFAPIINGDSNNITINPDPVVIIITPSPTTATPAPATPSSSCSGYCTQGGGTININPPAVQKTSIKTTAVNGWWTFVQMVISPFIVLNDWIIQNK